MYKNNNPSCDCNHFARCVILTLLCCAFTAPQCKGNVYKNKRVLMEAVHKQKAEKIREKAIADQFEARRAKNKASRERKMARREERFSAGLHLEQKPVAKK